MAKYSELPLLKDGCVYNSSEVVDNKLFVFGGCDIKGKALDSSQYVNLSTKDEFIEIKNMPRTKAGASITHMDDRIVTIGGIYDKQCQLDKVDMYDIGSNTWLELDSLRNPVQGSMVLVKDNILYCAGGLSKGMATTDDFAMMDLSNGRWQALPKMPSAHFSAGCFLYQDNFYIIGGRDGKLFNDKSCCYDFRAQSWRTLPKIPTEYRNVFNCCVHFNDDAYIIGGLNEVPSQGFSGLVYKFDLKTEKWEKMSNILKPRADFGAFAIDDKLLIAGGMGQLQGLSATVEIFNSKSKKWSLVDDLPTFHASSSKCLNGRSMYLVSGMSNNGLSRNVTEITL